MSYKVGFKHPPVSSQFKKGQSGNPKGRPKGSKNFLTVFKSEMAQTVVVNENGKQKKISRGQAIAKRVVVSAMQGDPKSIKLAMDMEREVHKHENASCSLCVESAERAERAEEALRVENERQEEGRRQTLVAVKEATAIMDRFRAKPQ